MNISIIVIIIIIVMLDLESHNGAVVFSHISLVWCQSYVTLVSHRMSIAA